MKEYAVVYEWAGNNYSAYVPDLPGCIACGGALEETSGLMKGAIEMYIAALKEEGMAVPEPSTKVGLIRVAV